METIGRSVDGCENCGAQQRDSVLSTGQVPITNALIREIRDTHKPLDTLEPDVVEDYLRKNLNWKVVKVRCLSNWRSLADVDLIRLTFSATIEWWR
jgi:hypothetical protein